MMSTFLNLLCRALCACLFFSGPALADDFLSPEDAFVLTVQQHQTEVVVGWKVAHGYKLYKKKIQITVADGDAALGALNLPKAVSVFDQTFNETVEVYKAPLAVRIKLPVFSKKSTLQIVYQGCADEGLCYPPQTRQFALLPDFDGAAQELIDQPESILPAASSATTSVTNSNSATTLPVDEAGLAESMLKSRNLWQIGLGFWLFGLLLSFTPCVLPMVPILSSIIVGQDAAAGTSKMRGFLMALSYCAGMAMVYTSLGVAAGLMGEGLAAYLQKPWVLITFASLLVVFALSMFDVFQLQLPAALQGRLSSTSSQIKGGRFAGVFLMGALSALIVGPCVAGPLAGALIYISQTKDVWLGGWALFAMAAGMSVPLLLAGVSAGSLLPRAGVWMVQVKNLFGLLLLAVAFWMIVPLLSTTMVMVLAGALALLCSLYLGLLDAPVAQPGFRNRIAKLLSLLFLALAALELIGAAAGAPDALQPLRWPTNAGHATVAAQNTTTVRFQRIGTVQELDKILKSSVKPVLLDFYADWCVSCKEMERFTFSDPQVEKRLADFTLLQADVTNNTAQDRELMKRFALFGPPGIIVFSADGLEIKASRVIGFAPATKFLTYLKAAI
jgi:thiol:disulfide interchange protein DsbD